MFVQLFIALSAQLVMIWQSTYLQKEFLVLVFELFSYLVLEVHPCRIFLNEFTFLPLSAYHAGLNSKVRSSVLDDWISSRTQVVVATVAFGYALLSFHSFFLLTFSFCVCVVCVYVQFSSRKVLIQLVCIARESTIYFSGPEGGA